MGKRCSGSPSWIALCPPDKDHSSRHQTSCIRHLLNAVAIAAGLSIAAIPIGPAAASDFSCVWTTGTSGFFNVAGNWSTCNGTIPNNGGSTFDATIAAAGTYTVTLNTAISLNNLTLNAAGATVDHTSGVLTMAPGGVINIQAGAYRLSGGTISGGTIQQTGSNGLQFTSSSGTLDGVTVRGTLDLSGTSNRVRVINGLTLLTQAGAAPGAVNLTGNSSILTFDGAAASWTQTFDNATLTMGTAAGNQGNVTVERGGNLTLGAGAVVQGTGEFGTTVFLAGGANALINQGTMSANFSGRALNVGTTNVNSGVNAFTNSGILEARNGGTLTINALNWTNSGQINVVDATSTINLGGTLTNGALGTFSNGAGGTLNLTGKLNNTTTLTFGATTGKLTLSGGTIQGGTVQENGANGLAFAVNNNNALDNVTVRGVLDLSAASSRLRVFNGLTLQTEAGGAPGVANVTGNGSYLLFDGAAVAWSQSFNNATINLGTAAGNQGNITIERGGSLTLGAGAVVQGTGEFGTTILVAGGGPESLTNLGTISANLNGRALNVGATSVNGSVTTFTNSGTLEARNGGTLTINALNWTNGGQINVVDATSTINLGGTLTNGALGTFNNGAGGHLNLTGKLNNTTLTFGPGTGSMTLSGGTIQGGTVQENGANGLAFAVNNSNMLDNVTVRGVLDLSAANSRLRVLTALALQTEAGGAPGVANITGNGSYLLFDGTALNWSQSFNNATINLGTAAGNQGNITVERGGNLTLGTGAVVQGTGEIGTTILVAGGGPESLTNQGTISANLNARALNVGSTSVNGSVTTFTNSGTLEARNGGILTINAANWSNTGAINVVDAASTINLGGTFTSGALATFNNGAGGHLNLTGKLNNTTLTFGPGTGSMTLAGGTIQGGTVQENGANGLVFAVNNANTLDNVTVRGVLDLSATTARTRVLNGLVLQTEAGGAPGVANVTGNGSYLLFDGTALNWSQSFNNATINLGTAAGNQGNITIERGGSLTLGAGAVVQGTGEIGTTILVAGGGPESLTNQGTISANLNARTLTVGATSVNGSVTTFTNSGTLEARNGGILTINAANWSNTGAINVVDAASTINLGGTFTSGALATFNNGAGGHLNLTGKLNNTTLTFGPGTGSMTLAGGTIQGGTVQENGANGLAFAVNNANTLDNVTVRGLLDLSATNAGHGC